MGRGFADHPGNPLVTTEMISFIYILHSLHGLLCDMQARGQQNSCHAENHATNVLLFIETNLHARHEN